MRSDVNQAYLRAYVKNRAANASNNSAVPDASVPNGIPLPAENTPGVARRLDPAIRHAPAPKSVIAVDSTPSAPVKKSVPLVATPIPPNSNTGVWSPLGVERGMKGVGTQASRPPAIMNTSPPASYMHLEDDEASVLNTLPSNPAAGAVNEIAKTESSQVRGASPVPAMRIDPSHAVARSRSQPLSTMPAVPHGERNIATNGPTPSKPTPVSHLDNRRHREPTIAPEKSRPAHENSPEGQVPVDGYRIHRPNLPNATPTPRNAPAGLPEVNPTSSLPPKPHLQLGKQVSAGRGPSANAKSNDSVTDYPASPATQSRVVPLPLTVAFTSSWEVDQFFWPEVVTQIQTAHGDAFEQIGKHLRLANQDGLKVMAITSGERGVGRSTVAMHMARCAAAAGLNVALVDADTFYPSMIDQLRLDMEHGWQDCLFENVPLEEVAVKSLSDNITVFPLTSVISQQQLHVNLHRMAKIIKRISTAFDIVFLDSNRLNLEQRDLIGVAQESVVDAAILVVDTELSMKEKVDTGISILQGMGIASIGIVENFHG